MIFIGVSRFVIIDFLLSVKAGGGSQYDGHGDFAYMVDDIDYCIEQAMDMVNGIGDYDTPSPDEDVDVTWLDNVEVLKEADY